LLEFSEYCSIAEYEKKVFSIDTSRWKPKRKKPERISNASLSGGLGSRFLLDG
jgi:hypothetical protein